MPPGNIEGLPSMPPSPERRAERPTLQGFVNGALQRIQGGLRQSGVDARQIQRMRGRPGSFLDRFVSGLNRSGGFRRLNRVLRGRSTAPEMHAVTPEAAMTSQEAAARLENLKQKLPALQFDGFPEGFDPARLEQRFAKLSIRPGDYKTVVGKLEAAADRIVAEAGTRPGWQNAEAWMQNVACDGMRIWAFNAETGESCMATGHQLLFGQGSREQILGARGRGAEGSRVTRLQTLSGMAVQWEETAMGSEFTIGSGRKKVYERNNDGATVQVYDGGSSPASVTHFGETVVTRMNRNAGGMVPASARIEDGRGTEQLPRGTFVRTPGGEWLGNGKYEIQKRGMEGYMNALAQLPVRELGAYISSIMNGQDETPYQVKNRSQAIAFRRLDMTFGRSLANGLGDCRIMAKLGERVLRMKGVRAITIQLDPDHCGAVWIEPSGDPARPYVARSIESSGFHDDFKPGRTPGEALIHTWDAEKGSHPGAASILNDKLRSGRTSYDRVAAAIVNDARAA